MRQKAYDARQRAKELLNETINIWRKSDHSDQLEGLEQDPVFALLMTALAYQANETDGEIEQLKQDVLDEYARLLTPYEAGSAIPATAVVETALQSGVSELFLNERSTFILEKGRHSFMPLIQSRIINARVNRIVRMDGHRWKLSLDFPMPLNDLSGLTFAIRDARFQDVKISIDGKLLPLVKPWHYANMPLQHCFSVKALLYNQAQLYQASMKGFDLYAKQDVALFYVKKHNPTLFIPFETEHIDLIFDFSGIADDYVFDKEHFSLNVVLLVNAQLGTATLSSSTPLVRITGYNGTDDGSNRGKQLMHLVPPAQEQLFGKTPVEVRRVAADRFNQASLIRLTSSLISKYNSDYYAFQSLNNGNLQAIMSRLQEDLTKLINVTNQNVQQNVAGVYLMLNKQSLASASDAPFSLDIEYLTTEGEAVNEDLRSGSNFIPPAGIDASNTHQITAPTNGFNEVNDTESVQSMLRYYVVTNDRIVTPADMKIFCYTELQSRYYINPEMVESITVKHLQQPDRMDNGYVIHVDIYLQETPFLKRSFSDKVREAEIHLQKMMETRSSNIFPICVTIQMSKETT